MNPIALWSLLVAIGFGLGGAGAWTVQGWRYDAEMTAVREESAKQVAEQAARNRELQRQAEMRYVVQAEEREKVIVQTVTEIRHETDNLRACALTAAARERLRAAAACARGDSAAACGPDKPVPNTR